MAQRILIYLGIAMTIVCYYFFILALMNLFPLFIAGPLLFGAIMFTIKMFNERKKFRGFH
ncbi:MULTISPECIES: hypothetical protein [Bacillaceae]|uniref:hypothetical protein n=1 Tax=Bacillaceae TaxID=186817 RepID=UPI0005522A17|nr:MULTISPECIES: hypothetical protein [Bacillaceae]UOE93145.1 hypothetical protein MM271_18340 [Alkalihalobacillus sp. LMS39]